MHRGSQLDEEDEADEEAEDEEKRKAADIKSNNPHLAGGEKTLVTYWNVFFDVFFFRNPVRVAPTPN